MQLYGVHCCYRNCNFPYAEALINAGRIQLDLMVKPATETASKFKTIIVELKKCIISGFKISVDNPLKEFLASRILLRDHAGSSDHGEAAVVELLGLHLFELLGILGLEAKRVEAQISWHVV